ncbi:MAG: hypothetical protein BGO63_00470 [Candidatus Accumulibacter sp. 66-26]|nr:DUF2325 domain-containing protein [Accumulibacter sp.]OJW49967.1 MAG: hypothetical protein BGO63_00470 [Candidatus Accumulibacter sp. 66-26]
MSTLIVGGDRVATYKDFLAAHGFGPVHHWNGRRNSECHRSIPVGTRLVVIMIDQVNHSLATKMRRVADELALPVVFSRRSIGQLGQAITRVKHGAGARATAGREARP